MKEQITSRIIMVRPANFGFNTETASNNAFQMIDKENSALDISKKAMIEFDQMVNELRSNGIHVDVWEDTSSPVKPDAIFPNNWFSTHQDNSIVTYPMYAKLRRPERRDELVESLDDGSTKRYSFEYFEEEDKYLEGTGSMILDRPNKIVYACLSERTSVEILDKFSVLKNYKKVYFNSIDRNGGPIYHTNVMMTVGESFAVICLESLPIAEERKAVLQSFKDTKKEVIDISFQQMERFAGNMIQLKNEAGKRFIVMSHQAKKSLNQEQILQLSKHGKIIAPDIHTIETTGGGSARCMIAENFLHKQGK